MPPSWTEIVKTRRILPIAFIIVDDVTFNPPGELRQSAPTVRNCRSGEGENCGQAQVGGSCCSSDM